MLIPASSSRLGIVYFSENKTAYLATAVTSRSHRKQGVHEAIIFRRIEAARERGSKRISATALLKSQSRRNLEKCGLTLSHVQTLYKLSEK